MSQARSQGASGKQLLAIGAASYFGIPAKEKEKQEEPKDFDQARREAFQKAGLTNPEEIRFTQYDEKTGTVTEFKGPRNATVGYDEPHEKPGEHHDKQHISWKEGGKPAAGGGKSGNIPYTGPRHPSRPDRKKKR